MTPTIIDRAADLRGLLPYLSITDEQKATITEAASALQGLQEENERLRGSYSAEPAAQGTTALVPERFADTFNGDEAQLLGSIEALLDLDARKALVPNRIGGHARTLLSAAAARLQARTA